MVVSRAEPWSCTTLGDASKPAVVFLHGFLGRGRDWEPIAKRLSNQFFCIMPDLPGHGTNITLDPAVPLSYETMAAGLAASLAAMGIRPVILVGYSLGGRIALHASLYLKDLVRALVLESTSAGIEDTAERQQRSAADDQQASLLELQGMQSFLERWYQQPLFASLERYPKLLARLKRVRGENQVPWMARVLRELSPGVQPYLGEHWAELAIPTLMIAGRLDTKYASLLGEAIAENSRIRGILVPFAGHTVHAERPERFVGLLRAFLLSLP